MDAALLPIGTWLLFDRGGEQRADRGLVGVVNDHALGAMLVQTSHPGFPRERVKPEAVICELIPAPQPKFAAGDLVHHTFGRHQTYLITGQMRWNGPTDTGCFSHRLVVAADGSEAGWVSECYLTAETRKSRLAASATA